MKKDEENRKLAEWLGFRYGNSNCYGNSGEGYGWHHSECKCPDSPEMNECECHSCENCDLILPQDCMHGCRLHLPDFYADEAASGQLLDKLLKSIPYKQILLDAETCFTDQPRELNECEQDHEACIFAHLHIYIHGDRKKAIAEAALVFIAKDQL